MIFFATDEWKYRFEKVIVLAPESVAAGWKQ
jgi:hypothetical protein